MSKRYDDALEFLDRSAAWLDKEFGPEETARGYYSSNDLQLQRRIQARAAGELRRAILTTPGIVFLFRVFPFA